MSDEPTPELRALAAQLFAAGRAERPGPALGRRLLLIEPAPTSREARAPASGVEPRVAVSGAASVSRARGRRARSPWVSMAAAAAFAAGGVGVWWSLEQEPVFDMSPDPVSARARSAPVAPSLPSQPSPLPERGAVSPSLPPVARDGDRPHTAPEAPARVTSSKRSPPTRVTSEPARARRPSAPTVSEARGAASAQAAEAAPEPAVSAPAAVGIGLSEELALLKEARFALRVGEAQRALDVLDRHARARGADGLHAEATLLRIEALAALGRRAEASQLAARFVRENPFNALADRAKSFIGASGAAP